MIFTSAAAQLTYVLNLLGLVAVVLCYVRRKEAIGGWLMYFLCQIYVWTVSYLLTSISTAATLYPAWPTSKPSDPVPLVLAVLPRLIGFAAVAIVATALLKFRDWIWVVRLRFTIGFGILLVGASLVVDRVYFPTAFPSNLVRWIALCAWLVYFFVSVRVRMVFLTKDWGKIPAAQVFG